MLKLCQFSPSPEGIRGSSAPFTAYKAGHLRTVLAFSFVTSTVEYPLGPSPRFSPRFDGVSPLSRDTFVRHIIQLDDQWCI